MFDQQKAWVTSNKNNWATYTTKKSKVKRHVYKFSIYFR